MKNRATSKQENKHLVLFENAHHILPPTSSEGLSCADSGPDSSERVSAGSTASS